MQRRRSRGQCLVVAAAMAMLSFTTGCDPTLKSTVEDGVISVSTSFFGSFLRALFALATEAQTSNTNTTTNTGTSTNTGTNTTTPTGTG